MALRDQIIQATRQAMRAETGQPLTLTRVSDSTTGSCFEGDIRSMKDLEPGGFMEGYDTAFFVLNSDWSTAFDAGEKVTINSVTYRVMQTLTSTNDPATALLCNGVDA